jgi:CheY-like chemotaxis protein
VAPDVVLLDLRLPGMDGLALVRQLRASEGTQHIPIVVVTAYPESYPRHTMLEAGCDAYIGKPIDTRSLPNQIAEAVARRSA